MNTLESAINIGIMTQEGGAEYLYELANNTLSDEERVDILKDVIYKYYGTFLEYEMQEELLDSRGKDVGNFMNSDLLYYIGSRILRETDWLQIINYHKEDYFIGWRP